MKRLIVYVVILILAVWAGLWLKTDPGYVLIAYKKWTVETSLWFGLILISVFFLVLYYLFRFLQILLNSHGHLLRWYRQRTFIKSHTLTGAGLLALEEGYWDDAEELLLRGLKSSTIPVVNYLNAARAAQYQFEYQRRDDYLKKALEFAEDKERIAVYLTQASLQIEHEQYEQANQTLDQLVQQRPKHRFVLKLLQELYKRQGDWDNLLKLLPRLRERRVLDKAKERQLELLVYTSIFRAKDKSTKELKSIWKKMPSDLRDNSEINQAYEEATSQ